MTRQCENAREVAAWFSSHPKVEKVNHPSLAEHPDHDTAERVLAETGGLLSFELAAGEAGGREDAFRFLNALKLCVKAPSLGDVYTLAIHPATSSHRELSPARRGAVRSEGELDPNLLRHRTPGRHNLRPGTGVWTYFNSLVLHY